MAPENRLPDDDAPSPDASFHEASFQVAYERLAPALWVWASRHASQTLRSKLEIDDVIQEVWLRAFRDRAKFQGDDSGFRAWIFRIAKLVLLESHRGAARLQRFGHGAGATENRLGLEAVPESITRLSQRVAREEGVVRLLEHLTTLDADDQELVSCCGLEGATCAEAARRIGIGEAAAIKRWQRLRARLRGGGLADAWIP